MRPCNRAATVKLFALVSTLLAALLSNGCLSVPQVGPAFGSYRSEQGISPTGVGAPEPLTATEAAAVQGGPGHKSFETASLEHLLAVQEAISGHPLVSGNRVILLPDRPTAYTAMFKEIRNAKKNIDIETYTLSADRAGYFLANLLLQKAAQGVHVNIIYDSIGSIATPPSFFQRLTTGGIAVLPFNPINPLSVLPFAGRWSLVHRDHRKLAIVDGITAFIGSANISDICAETAGPLPGTAGKELPWRDTDVEIKGPVVARFQKLFLDTWKKELGPPIVENSGFLPPAPEGDDLVMAVGSTWGEKNRDNYLAYLAAISSARHSIHLTCSYFVPDRQLREALAVAALRGVDVKIILPHRSDSRLALYGGRSYYGRLLKSGVKLYERTGVLLHAKTAVIDGVWSTIGSTNLDFWSILRNNELNAVILSRSFAEKMDTLFTKELAKSKKITVKKWESRSPFERMLEHLSAPLVYWL
ncbi:MAG: phospholipase D-like domain-containing protein [Syntrophobacteraceae bacterium]|nr:phospholipase D-like domain-containing protein [Syntrophobacteraceae bacterium]